MATKSVSTHVTPNSPGIAACMELFGEHPEDVIAPIESGGGMTMENSMTVKARRAIPCVDSMHEWLIQTHPLPAENWAHVVVEDDSDPQFLAGDVLLVDMGVRSFEGDGAYAVEIEGSQCIRRLQDRGTIHVYAGKNPSEAVPFNPERMRVLGIVSMHAHARSLT